MRVHNWNFVEFAELGLKSIIRTYTGAYKIWLWEVMIWLSLGEWAMILAGSIKWEWVEFDRAEWDFFILLFWLGEHTHLPE